MKAKLEDGKYDGVEEVARDIRLIWSNCILYNSSGSEFGVLAAGLAKKFEERYSKVQPKKRPPSPQHHKFQQFLWHSTPPPPRRSPALLHSSRTALLARTTPLQLEMTAAVALLVISLTYMQHPFRCGRYNYRDRGTP